MRIIDMHCDTLLEGWRKPGQSFYDGDTAVNLKLLKENQSMVQFFAMYISGQERESFTGWQMVSELYGYYCTVMERYGHIIGPVLCPEDVEFNVAEGKMSALLTVEDGVFIDPNMNHLRGAYDMGVRLVTLTWNYENPLGYPASDDSKEHLMGLKNLGVDVVREMNRLGMIIDVSHLSEGGFYDVAMVSNKPFVASHSCARALCNHRRNLTDHQLRTLGDKGGTVGVNFEKTFLREDGEKATYDDVIRHLVHIRDVAGIEAVSFGSDFDGIDREGDMIDYSRFSNLLLRMENTFTYDEMEKICNRNVLRVMREVL